MKTQTITAAEREKIIDQGYHAEACAENPPNPHNQQTQPEHFAAWQEGIRLFWRDFDVRR